ncbi:MAG: ABC transporter permease [Muribaculaceae bacterium]|nr:ABC transporter permease [Muribaculaceae bacterium]
MDVRLFFNEAMKRGFVQLVRRPVFYIIMIVAPLLCSFFMLDLMRQGVVQRVPVGIVDLDGSSISRSIERNLGAMQNVSITHHYRGYQEAISAVQRDEVLGFIYLPAGLEHKALSGQDPTVSYYINYAYFTPASTQYKGFKTITLLANGAIAKTTLEATGLLTEGGVSAMLQPILTRVHGLNNPWTNYSFYLNLSFVPCLLALFILLMTSFSIGTELKYGTCREWIASAGGSIEFAVAGKLFPQTLIFTSTGWMIQLLMFRVYGLPLNGNVWNMIVAMPLLVLACQAFALTMMCITPNFRYGTTLSTLLGVMSFSFCGFSLPSDSMYAWVHALGNVMPVRYYFLLSIDQALNGIPLYYSRYYYAALVAFTLLPWCLLWRLKRECINPVYVP